MAFILKKEENAKHGFHHADICLMNTKVEDRKCRDESSNKINKHQFLPNVSTQKKQRNISPRNGNSSDTENRKSESKSFQTSSGPPNDRRQCWSTVNCGLLNKVTL